MSMVVAVALLATSCSAVIADVAAGLEPGVHVDPGSPAAKEYALPLSQGRQAGAGSTSSSGAETPFGAGIKPPGSGGPGSHSRSAGGGATGSRQASPNRSAGRGEPKAAVPPAVQQAVDSQGSSGGSGSLPVLIGGGVAILVIGGFGGTVLRHNRRPTPSR
jgi:hypothetical protein